MSPLLSNIKNYIIYALLGLLILCGIDVYIKSCQIAESEKTIKEQETAIVAKNSAIAKYKKNIQLAKEHQARVVVIKKKSAIVQKQIKQIKNVRNLTNEEIIPAIAATDLFNGVRSSDSKTGTGGKILPGSDQAGTAKSNDSSGFAGKL